jgi:hypothetical protein
MASSNDLQATVGEPGADPGRLVAGPELSEEPIIAPTRRVTPSLMGAETKVSNGDVGRHQDGTGDAGD